MRIEVNQAQIDETKALLGDVKDGAATVLARSMNRANKGIATDSAKEIAKELNLKQATIKKNYALNNATVAKLSANFRSTGRPIPLIEYGACQVKNGVSVQVKKSKGRKVIPMAFIAKMKSGHLGVFTRKKEYLGTGRPTGTPKSGYLYTQPGTWSRRYRLPVEEMYGPRVEDVFSNDDVMGKVIAGAEDRLQKTMEQQTEYLLKQNLGSGVD